MNAAFIVTKDFLDGGNPDYEMTGVVATRRVDLELDKRLMFGEGEAFRVLDDDRVPYYEGRYLGGNDEESVFYPLWYFSEYAGCTILQHKEHGKWVDI